MTSFKRHSRFVFLQTRYVKVSSRGKSKIQLVVGETKANSARFHVFCDYDNVEYVKAV